MPQFEETPALVLQYALFWFALEEPMIAEQTIR